MIYQKMSRVEPSLLSDTRLQQTNNPALGGLFKHSAATPLPYCRPGITL